MMEATIATSHPEDAAMTLPQTAEYALRAVLYIAASGQARPVRVEEIARALDVPRNYLSKTLHQLARAGILDSWRGPRGGFRLSNPPERTTLESVIAPFGTSIASGCLLGRSECRDDRPCPAHARWKGVAVAMRSFFAETTVADLMHRQASPTTTASRRKASATTSR
jgi:Rrf2 family protein